MRLPDHHLGDTWFYTGPDRVHMFYLVCPVGVPRHTCWSIARASSTDLMHWDDHGVIFDSRSGDPTWSCLSTGSVTRYGDHYVMAFVPNHNQPDPYVALAVSPNLADWQVLPAGGPRIDGAIYTRRGSKRFKNPRWRDPFLFTHDGWLYQLICAAREDAPDDADGVVGMLRSRDLARWEYLRPLDTPPLGTDLECPKLHYVDGGWHLMVSLFNVVQSPDFAARQPAGLNSSTTFSLVADGIEGPYRLAGSGRILQVDAPGFPYACSIVDWNNQWHLLGTCWSDRLGDRVSQPLAVRPTREGFRSC